MTRKAGILGVGLALCGMATILPAQAQRDTSAIFGFALQTPSKTEPELIAAIRRQDTSSARRLLEGGADVNVKDSQGTPALIVAVQYDQTEIVKRLLDKKADANGTDAQGFTALMQAAQTNAPDVMTVAKQLMEQGAKADFIVTAQPVQNKNGLVYLGSELIGKRRDGSVAHLYFSMELSTPLTAAALTGNVAVAKLFLERGADVNARTGSRPTALMFAAQGGHEEMMRTLIAGHADLNAQDKYGRTALMRAAARGSTLMVKLLLDAGAGMEIRDMDGNTALMLGAASGQEGAVRQLLAHHASVKARDRLGRTVLDWALVGENQAVIKLIRPVHTLE